MQWAWLTHCWCCGRGSPLADAVGVVLAQWAWFWLSGRGSPIADAVGVVSGALGVVHPLLALWAWFTHCWRCGSGSAAVGVVHPLLKLWYLVLRACLPGASWLGKASPAPSPSDCCQAAGGGAEPQVCGAACACALRCSCLSRRNEF